MKTLNWNELTSEQRNAECSRFMPASDVNPIRQWWLTFDGQWYQRLPLKEQTRDAAEKWLASAKESKVTWDYIFEALHFPWSFRNRVAVKEQTWHVRYSDTPGGAWELVEQMNQQGWTFSLSINNNGVDACFVQQIPHFREHRVLRGPFSEAVAIIFLRANGVNLLVA